MRKFKLLIYSILFFSRTVFSLDFCSELLKQVVVINKPALETNLEFIELAQNNYGKELKVTYGEAGPLVEYKSFFFTYLNQRSFDPKRRAFFNLLKNLSKQDDDPDIEYGGYIIEYYSGYSQAVRFTSRDQSYIAGTDFMKAVDGSRIEEHGPIKRIIDIHTHPWSEGYYSLHPSDADLKHYSILLDRVSTQVFYAYDQVEVDFDAYILPLCHGCDDIVIHTSKDQLVRSTGLIIKR